jgi:hypothetical protein
MPTEYDDLDTLIESREKNRGSYGDDVEKWKKREPPVLDAWLAGRLVSFYQHSLPEIVSWKKEDVSFERVFSRQYNCHETDTVSNHQNKRDKATGLREVPPEVCPDCLLVEWARERIFRGAWGGDLKEGADRVSRSAFEPIFVHEAANDDHPTVTRAAEFCGLIGDKTPEAWRAMAKTLNERHRAKIVFADAWKAKGKASQVFLFRIVDDSNVAAGVQKLVETSLLGDAVIAVIAATRESKGREKGDVYRVPYCIRLKHKPKEAQFNRRYEAIRMEEVEINDAIRSLLARPPLDYAPVVAPFSAKAQLAKLQKYCQLKDVPWGQLFDRAIARQEGAPEPAPAGSAAYSLPAAGPAPGPQRQTRAQIAAADPAAALRALKAKFDAIPESDESAVVCGAPVPGAEPCAQVMAGDYSGECPACALRAATPPPAPVAPAPAPRDEIPF